MGSFFSLPRPEPQTLFVGVTAQRKVHHADQQDFFRAMRR
jgi:hypothetical protein